jgi:hypothetical protein
VAKVSASRLWQVLTRLRRRRSLEWVDFWDPSRVYIGPGERDVPVGAVPPAPDAKMVTGREPIFIRRGALIPTDVRLDYTGLVLYTTACVHDSAIRRQRPGAHSRFVDSPWLPRG